MPPPYTLPRYSYHTDEHHQARVESYTTRRLELIEALKRKYQIPEGFEETAADIWYDGYEN
jgi:hypothetical protein